MIMESPGVTPQGLAKIERIPSWIQSAISIPHDFTATRPFASRAHPGRTRLIVIGGQNGVDSFWPRGLRRRAGQTRQALINLQACVRQSADLDHVVQWSILIKDGARPHDGSAAFVEIWGQRSNPPALGRHGQRLRSYRCLVRNRCACGGAELLAQPHEAQ
jgi:hypothetical protein